MTCLSEVGGCAARILLPFAKEERDPGGRKGTLDLMIYFLRVNGTEGSGVLYRREKLFFSSFYRWRFIDAFPLQV